MPYTIKFSDPTKVDDVTVPDMPPGINTVDTSLALVGKGYPNYGQKIAENFVHLLENFASPIPPENPIEGQLWYDTSDPSNKKLRIMDGTATATRWPTANGIYQQGTDPSLSATQGLRVGDIWVDTANNQLRIWNSNVWTLVGPQAAGPEPTGAIPAVIRDTQGLDRRVILNKVSGETVAIFANEQFTPRSVINGFTILKPGLNLSSTSPLNEPLPILNGTAFASQNLVDSLGDSYSTDSFLRKNDQTSPGQIIEGLVRFKTPSTNTTLTGQGRDGVVIINGTTNNDTNYVQLYKGDNDAVLLNNTTNGKIVFKTKEISLATVLELSKERLDLTGDAYISKSTYITNTLTVYSTASLSVNIFGGVSAAKNVTLGQNLRVASISTFTGLVNVGSHVIPTGNSTQDLGNYSNRYRQVYADIMGHTGSVFVGIFNGLANGLQQSTNFRIVGQVTATSVLYNGTGTSATFVTTLQPEAIYGQTVLNTSTSTLNLLVLDTATNMLHKIARDSFIPSPFFTGMITAYGVDTNIPSGWLLCDGSEYIQTGTYSNLYVLLGSKYGIATAGNFKVPDLRKSTTWFQSISTATTTTAVAPMGTDTISLSTTTNIVPNLIVEGTVAIQNGTTVTSVIGYDVKLSTNVITSIGAGTLLSFSSASYVSYIIKI